MSRQRLLYRQEPPQCHFFINEVALRCPVGGPRVMHEQMLKLLFTSDQPHITVRVVPLSAGAHAGMRGPFMMMRFAENRPVVHVETEAASLFHESSADIELYQLIVSELSRCSLDEEESRSMFAALANEHDRALGEIRGGMANQLV